MKRKEIISFDKKTLSFLEWDTPEPRGLVQVIHSKGENAERYDKFCDYLSGRGYLVFALDLRCHGKTDELTLGSSFGDVWTDTLKDIALISKDYLEKYPKLKLGIFGHGYGSFLALGFLERFAKFPSAIVLGGNYSISKIRVNRLICALLHLFNGKSHKSKLLNKLSQEGFLPSDYASLSSDLEEVEKIKNDSSIGFDMSNGFFLSYFGGILKTFKREKMLSINADLPMLIMCGGADKIGKYGKSSRQLKKNLDDLGMKNVQLKVYQNALHDYLFDTSREQARSDIAKFFDENLK